jgi:NADH-quinone oxidoreductase subunit J
MDVVVFVVATAIILVGAVGVVLRGNPVHAALNLVMTLFGVAVLFVAEDAHFLAAVQVIVYAGAIVVLFLFVIMLLGVDRSENLRVEPLKGQRPAAALAGLALLALVLVPILRGHKVITGVHSSSALLRDTTDDSNVVRLSRSLFSDYVFAFEITSVLLVIAVIGAVLMARRPPKDTPSS